MGLQKRQFARTVCNIGNRFVSYLNGSDNEIVGAILDGSIRLGYQLNESVDSYFNLRYLGGGAIGTDPDSIGPGDGYVKNWLHFLTVSGGFIYEF